MNLHRKEFAGFLRHCCQTNHFNRKDRIHVKGFFSFVFGWFHEIHLNLLSSFIKESAETHQMCVFLLVCVNSFFFFLFSLYSFSLSLFGFLFTFGFSFFFAGGRFQSRQRISRQRRQRRRRQCCRTNRPDADGGKRRRQMRRIVDRQRRKRKPPGQRRPYGINVRRTKRLWQSRRTAA